MPYLYIDVAYQYIDGVYYSDIHFWAILDAVRTGDPIFHFHFSSIENDDTMKLPYFWGVFDFRRWRCGGVAAFFWISRAAAAVLFLCFIGAKKKSKNRLL